MKTETEIEHPFTVEQLRSLTPEQRKAVETVAEYLSGHEIYKDDLTDEEITSMFNLLKPCDGCVPSEEADEDLLNSIRKKFGAVYEVGMELAEAELKEKKITDFNFCPMTEPSYEDATHIAVVDYKKPICYLHEWSKAWHLSFASLVEVANAVLQVKKKLVEKVIESSRKEIFILIEGGVVHEVVNLPENINVTVIDYDIEGVEKERLEISPVDGELCVINKW
jgi:hypothetical protein